MAGRFHERFGVSQGLSPWGLGPAYIIHDWLFEVHRCHRTAPPEIAAMSFEDTARALGETAKALVEAGLIDHNLVEEVTWAVTTGIARDLWNCPVAPGECSIPLTVTRGGASTVVDFVIPPPRGRLR